MNEEKATGDDMRAPQSLTDVRTAAFDAFKEQQRVHQQHTGREIIIEEGEEKPAVEMCVGDALVFDRKSNPQTGYQWIFETHPASGSPSSSSSQPTGVLIEDDIYRTTSRVPVGPPSLGYGMMGTEKRRFVALKEGQVVLEYGYVLPRLLKYPDGDYKYRYKLDRQLHVTVLPKSDEAAM
ncbi:unnamed protein product [Vitrella brassicaformis CCMP3155]|uniref:Proteinase inhibitor I42 chagasin domain-containing protein n=1 Tax=Vitrella brassicaformis (strain CCMP3155) TaxID=1169540 RepID=A0A0G4GUI7_VITBC|nr:unnamed protein product [Vitrella brassicaformis CCMP3155]|mmetsp:Transcript_5297/g.12498  ORF Transcript_5297/g.12498 Transcript_5297/m.12498 type:complete len:180 (-) Transcript_5297:375-914(-)|eukprot:CEM34438.1 unnamed protein product [Vitrella brassicaformis CCMP3155]